MRSRYLYFVTLQLYDLRVVKGRQAAHRNQWTQQLGELVVLVQGRVTAHTRKWQLIDRLSSLFGLTSYIYIHPFHPFVFPSANATLSVHHMTIQFVSASRRTLLHDDEILTVVLSSDGC